MSSYRIPFNKPGLVGPELQYMSEVVQQGHISGDGLFTERCHRLLEQELGVSKALLTTSGTHALELIALLLNVQPGDEVIVPSFTFVSTINAFTLRGATPVFADIRADTLNLDETRLEPLVTKRTRAIVPVHYAGVGCEMDSILAVGKDSGAAVVEDNAHGLFGRYKDKHLGTFGCLAAQSFHETKNLHCGEAGALLINDPRFIARAEIIREKGTNRSAFLRGQVDKYTWVDIGSSYLPSDLLAAFLYAQLEARKAIQKKRERLWRNYHERLKNWADERGVGLPISPPHCEHPYHMFYLVMPSLEERQALLRHLRTHGILGVFHYVPLHSSPMGRKLGGRVFQCPVAEDVSRRLLRLPFYNDLTPEDQSVVISTVKSFRLQRRCAV